MSVDFRYYRLHIIPSYRLNFMDLRLKKFIKDYGVRKRPIDCTKLVRHIQALNHINLEIGFIENITDKFDAEVKYYPYYDLYTIIINRKRISYPFQCSRDRRLNFTLAHEIGHIFLDHLLIPKHMKTKEQLEIEEEEANEFAGRLLLPEEKLLSCNFVSFETVSSYFNVSRQALWKRLNHLMRLDLLNHKPIAEQLKKLKLVVPDDEIPFEPHCFTNKGW